MIFSRSTLLVLFATVVVIVFPQAVLAAEGFTPLTQIPGIDTIASSSGLPEFLNNIYQLCIGAAAVLAVLQIMRGGIIYMMGDSITEKKEAKDLITMSIVGLLLVLSPAIVFGIIDPRILNLNVGFDKLNPGQVGNTDPNSPFGPNGTMASGTWESNLPDAQEACQSQGGTPTVLDNGNVRCDQASAPRDQAFPHGRTSIEMNEVSACRAQNGCTVEALVRSNYNCWCSGSITLAEGQFHSAITTTGMAEHPSCAYVRVQSYPTREACQAGLPAIQDYVLTGSNNSTLRFECYSGTSAVLDARECSATGTLSL
ncbi:MAG: pilin [Patescibacteria group bacterium]